MRSRCNNPRVVAYPHYGGRGVKVCARWDSFENFLADMGEPGPGMSIERTDVNGPYEKSNCTWIPLPEQQSNTRKSLRITVAGETLTAAQWARKTGQKPTVIVSRVRRGWSDHEAVHGRTKGATQ
jgi:hypothetical protein